LKQIVHFVSALLVCAPMLVSAAQSEVNDDINRLYDVIVQSYYELDSKPLETLYDENACLMSMSANTEFYRGKESIMQAVNKWFSKVRKRDANIMINFRVIDRQITGSVVTDAGYYLIRYTPNKKSEQPISEFAGKYVFNFKMDESGKWVLYSDSATTSKPELFYSAQSEADLYYSQLQQMITAKLP
jgi:ketosteroid isomerase-like protein